MYVVLKLVYLEVSATSELCIVVCTFACYCSRCSVVR